MTASSPSWRAPEKKGAFGGFIGPKNLVELVRSAAPWLFEQQSGEPSAHALANDAPPNARLHELGHAPHGWAAILRHHERLEATATPSFADRTDYFALCLAAHFASVATYVPTDVDSKIRQALWFEPTSVEERAHMRSLALAISAWDLEPVSARHVHVQGGAPLSGHDGERLSVWCGALLGHLAVGDDEHAKLFEDAIDKELAREAQAFLALEAVAGRELELLNVAQILTHNAGDVMQGLAAKGAHALGASARERFADLARERFERYGGAFGRAAELYRVLLAAEGHRHYPLREIKLLRADPRLLLPLGPFLDEWGMTLARWPQWKASERAQVLGGLLEGPRKVQGGESYFRALAGFAAAHPGGLESSELAPHLGSAARRELKSSDLRKKLAVRRESFEASYKKRARQVLAAWR